MLRRFFASISEPKAIVEVKAPDPFADRLTNLDARVTKLQELVDALIAKEPLPSVSDASTQDPMEIAKPAPQDPMDIAAKPAPLDPMEIAAEIVQELVHDVSNDSAS